MKTNKIIFGLLPLLLVIPACSKNVTPSNPSSEPTSSSSADPTSSEEPSSSSSEEPPVPPEEREQQAREELANIVSLVDGGDFTVSMTGFYSNDAEYYYSEGMFLSRISYVNNSYVTERGVGFIATPDGVIGFKQQYSDRPWQTAGYVKKTSSLEEAKALVDSKVVPFSLKGEDWRYVANDGTTSVFETENEDVMAMYAKLDNIVDATDLYEKVTLRIYNGLDEVRLVANLKGNNLQFTSATIANFGKASEQDEVVKALATAQSWTGNEWYETSIAPRSRIYELPFPSNGSKFYNVNNIEGDWSSSTVNKLDVKFIESADLSESFLEDLLADGYYADLRPDHAGQYCRELKHPYSGHDQDPSESSSDRMGVNVSFEYTEGTFIIHLKEEYIPNNNGTQWSYSDKSSRSKLNYIPFPNDGKAHHFYNISGGDNDFLIEFYESFEDIDYGQQLVDNGFTYIEDAEHPENNYYRLILDTKGDDIYTYLKVTFGVNSNGLFIQTHTEEGEIN